MKTLVALIIVILFFLLLQGFAVAAPNIGNPEPGIIFLFGSGVIGSVVLVRNIFKRK